jgi:predicted Zn-dependent protease with MMP-like domain
MKREHFVKVVEETLDSLPEEFRSRIQNVAVLVEDFPANQRSVKPGRGRLLLGVFHGVPTTKKSIFDLPSGGVSILLCKRPGFVFGDGCAREGAASLPSPSDVERFCALMTQLSPGPAFVPATES